MYLFNPANEITDVEPGALDAHDSVPAWLYIPRELRAMHLCSLTSLPARLDNPCLCCTSHYRSYEQESLQGLEHYKQHTIITGKVLEISVGYLASLPISKLLLLLLLLLLCVHVLDVLWESEDNFMKSALSLYLFVGSGI